MNPFTLTILLLLAPRSFVRRSVAHDVANEFASNKRLLASFPDKKLPPERLVEIEERAAKRVAKIRGALFGAFFYTATAVMMAVLSAMLLSAEFGRPTISVVYAIQIIAASVILIATLALLGWEIQSYGGSSLPEKANRWLFRSQYWVGTYLFVLAVSWDQSAI
jgi:hypothetical protein